jgi:predicted transglutaminase-like cysteine proteinase
MALVGGNRPDDAWKTVRCGRAAARAIPAALCAAAVLAAISGPAAATVMTHPGPFHSIERRSSKTAIFTKWHSMIRRYARERRLWADRCRYEGGSWCTIKRWHAFLRKLRGRAPRAQLRAVNAYMNRVPYITDQRNYGVIDYWATPRQFLTRGGDCEDYAIAKYLSLRALGWPRDRLRVAVVIDRRKRQAHAILIVYLGGNAYILDNQVAAIRRDAKVHYYHPVYSINERYWWFYMTARPASR